MGSVMPIFNGILTRDQGGLQVAPIFNELRQVSPLNGLQAAEAPIVQDEYFSPGQWIHKAQAMLLCGLQHFQQAGQPAKSGHESLIRGAPRPRLRLRAFARVLVKDFYSMLGDYSVYRAVSLSGGTMKRCVSIWT